MVKIGTAVLKQYPKGVQIGDCAKATLSEDLSMEDILEKLHIKDCAIVVCTKEQEDAVHMIAEDVAMIQAAGTVQEDEADDTVSGMLGSLFGKLKDTQMINAAKYKM